LIVSLQPPLIFIDRKERRRDGSEKESLGRLGKDGNSGKRRRKGGKENVVFFHFLGAVFTPGCEKEHLPFVFESIVTTSGPRVSDNLTIRQSHACTEHDVYDDDMYNLFIIR